MPSSSVFRELFLGFIKVHVLHHAAQKPVYGLWLIDELGRHGYRLSPGTLYPVLHTMEKDGLLKRREETVGGKVRKYYQATPQGRKALASARNKVKELSSEVLS